VGYGASMALDEALLTELKTTKASIDELQQKLKDLVAQLRDQGATAQEIAEALRGQPS
jgi:signal transduction histidine kinase